jgi:hypothetical protein
MRKASHAITFNRRVLHDVSANGVRGLSPLPGDLIGQFQRELHGSMNLTRGRGCAKKV